MSPRAHRPKVAIRVRELTVSADETQLSRVRDFVADACRESGLTPREVNNTKLAVDEACTNVIHHAYGSRSGEIRVRATIHRGRVVVSVFDRGVKFDYAAVEDPDLRQYVETGRKGGLGIFLINRLMDAVEYRSGADGNELLLTKQTRSAATSRILAPRIHWKGSLRYQFTLRAALGLVVIFASLWGYVFVRQTRAVEAQRATRWLEKQRLAESIADESRRSLMDPERDTVDQATLTAFVGSVRKSKDDVAYVHVVSRLGRIVASTRLNRMFGLYTPPAGLVLLGESGGVRWARNSEGAEVVRDVRVTVNVEDSITGELQPVGWVHLGVYEDAVLRSVNDPRVSTVIITVTCLITCILFIMVLVSIVTKPIQLLTDGVRAIGEGSLEGEISVEGPAEIGAIASVFNEITKKFKNAQASILEQEKLRKEIEVARQIQQSLLPRREPDVAGYDIVPYYRAAEEVGGDYYDFVRVDDESLGVVVADVSGKGVPGSLVMTMVRTALRMEARGNKNAADVMMKMNDFVMDDMKKGMFVTMFYVILDSRSRVVSYASAGHNPMILYRAESKETYSLNPHGFPVGISLPDTSLFRRSIELETVKLKKGDMLVIYTDGITEAMNGRREQFGESRLLGLVEEYGHLAPVDFVDKLKDSVKTFTGGYPQSDDITVVAIKEKSAHEKPGRPEMGSEARDGDARRRVGFGVAAPAAGDED